MLQFFPNEVVLAEYNFSEFFETTIEPIYQAWLTLPDGWREKMEQHFNWLTCNPDAMLSCSTNSWQLSNVKYNGVSLHLRDEVCSMQLILGVTHRHIWLAIGQRGYCRISLWYLWFDFNQDAKGILKNPENISILQRFDI